jgi:hypothetical protein
MDFISINSFLVKSNSFCVTTNQQHFYFSFQLKLFYTLILFWSNFVCIYFASLILFWKYLPYTHSALSPIWLRSFPPILVSLLQIKKLKKVYLILLI